MPQVDSWDYPNRRYYLSFDTVTNGVDFAAAYLEERAYRKNSGENIRGQRPMLRGDGNLPKGGGDFTPQFVTHLNGARPVPFDTSHNLLLLVEPIADDGSVSGIGILDRSPLSPGVTVNADVGYEQVAVKTVPTGGALTPEQATQLSDLAATLQSAGVFSKASLAQIEVQSSVPAASTRFDINVAARAEEGVENPTSIVYREIVFCPDANGGIGRIFIGQRNNTPVPFDS